MKPTEFTMTAEHLARTLETVRAKERAKIATYLAEQADVVAASKYDELHPTAVAETIRGYAEYVSSNGHAQQQVRRPVPLVPIPEVDPLDRDIDAEVAAEERSHNVLPEVHHRDDFEEGTAIVRSRQARGISKAFPRD